MFFWSQGRKACRFDKDFKKVTLTSVTNVSCDIVWDSWKRRILVRPFQGFWSVKVMGQ